MDSNNGGLSSNERQRQTAAEIARKKVLAAYSDANQAEKIDVRVNTPTAKQASDAAWAQYHAAWQQYYQKYYSEYYAKAAVQYVEKEKMRMERAQADKARQDEENGSAAVAVQPMVEEDSFKARIQKIAREEQGRRKHRKFVPIIAGVIVVLLILFLQYNRLIFAPIMAYVSPGNTEDTGISEVDPTISVAVSDETKLLIPKLNIDVPLHLGIPNSEVMSAMNHGVAQFAIPGANAMPGEIGNLAISGHSAGDIYSSNQYKFIFSGLERLENGDLIYVDYQGVRYTYKMVDRKTVDPSDVQSLVLNTDKPMLTLITCWPLGVSTYRLLIIAEQINPVPSGATQGEMVDEGDNSTLLDSEVMPQNEPTLFQKIGNWLFGRD